MRCFYVTAARVPGAKAHCSQIAQMCKSFLNAGWDLELLRPRRADLRQYRGWTIEKWYGFERSIPNQALPCIDFLGRLPKRSPKIVRQKTFQLMGSTFTRALAAYIRRYQGEYFIYSRDVLVMARLLNQFQGVRKYVELHKLSDVPGEMWNLEKRVCERSEAVVVVTHGMKQMLVDRGVPETRILVEPNGVDPVAFPGALSETDARARLNLPAFAEIVAFVGNFQAVGVGRGLDTIVRSIPAVSAAHPNALFLFVGGPLEQAQPLIAELKALGVSEKHFRFVPRQPYTDLHMWLAAADVLLHPIPHHAIYTKITSPLKVFEYMTSGRAMVVSDLPSTREILTHERNALLVPPGDESAFACAINRLLRDRELASRLGKVAQKEARTRTWDARAQRISDWIDTVS